ncbi:hypothetical protein HYV31_01615 [candidate division WWE3 bacterium]|nr:hypothetical protein [candidate division WWE3 bacterium]
MLNVLVTGSSYGLGKHICEKLLENDYRVYELSRSTTKVRYYTSNPSLMSGV